MLDYPVPLPYALERPPAARAGLRGGDGAPGLWGECLFYPFLGGSLLMLRAVGLPRDGFFALHLHTGSSCATGGDIPFHQAGGHYDPAGVPHPDHAGDLPVLLSHRGMAYAMFYTGRFTPAQAVGRTLVIHDRPDDYRTQPAGDSGTRIACGLVRPLEGGAAPRRLNK